MRIALLALLVAAPALGQTVYQWTDDAGEDHFTDDRGTIPKGVTVRTTQGDDLTTFTWERPARAEPAKKDGGSLATLDAGGPRDLCALGRARISELEQALTTTRQKSDAALEERRGRCIKALNLSGQGAYATCMAEPVTRDPAVVQKLNRLEAELETARDDLRKAQISGCLE